MSAAITLDDLEAARDEARDVVMTLLSVAVVTPDVKDQLVDAMFELASVHLTIERVIESMGEPASEGGAP